MFEHLETFSTHLRVKNYAERSIETFRGYVSNFLGFLLVQGIKDIRGVSTQTIYAYQQYLYEKINPAGQRMQVESRNNYLMGVKAFFRVMLELGILHEDPSAQVKRAITPKRLPRSIPSNAEIKKILQVPDTKTAIGFRDRCILELFYSSGIRVSELANLKITDINFDDGVVQILRGKGNKDRIVPIGKFAAKYLQHYLKEVRPMLDKDPRNDTLFLTLGGRKFSGRWAINFIVKGYAEKSGIKKRVTPHSFRHAMATHMMKKNAPIRVIQEILGHSKLDSTQIYTRVTIMDLKECHARCHPRNADLI